MDSEIKRLLKLEQIKGFNLLDSEKKKLAEWKAAQKHIQPVVPKKPKIPKNHTEMEMGTEAGPTIIPDKEIGPKPEPEKVVNVVAPEDKTTGAI